jgi:hypothetical protein
MVWSPAGTAESTRQSSQASASSSTGAPVRSVRQAVPRNFSSAPPSAKRRASVSPRPSSSTFSAYTPARSIQRCVSEARSMQTSTSVGCSETEATALAVRPHGDPSSRQEVTTATPEPKCPTTLRNSLSSIILAAGEGAGYVGASGRVLALNSPCKGPAAPHDESRAGAWPGPFATQPRNRLTMRPYAHRAARRAATLLILTALAACDNVEWGGGSVQVITPPPPTPDQQPGPDPSALAGMGLPAAPVIFHVLRREDGTAQLIPVAELGADSMRTLRRPAGVSPEAYEQRFREAVMDVNSTFVLFRRGAEVGTLTVQAPGPATACGVPTMIGQPNTVAAAAAEQEFIAFRRGLSPQVAGEFSPPQVDGTIRRYASLIAERLVLQGGLQRPRSWPAAQRDLQAVNAIRGGHSEMAATYLVGDNLGVGPAQEDGWAVFYVAAFEARAGYTPFYSDVRAYGRTGKAAPRLVDALNWNQDEGSELLIQVYGTREAWYEAVSSDGGSWRRIFEGPRCIEPERQPRSIGAAERTGQGR